jgi:hypothetical protein
MDSNGKRRLYFLFQHLESRLISCYVCCVITDHSFSIGVFQNSCPILVCISTFRGSWYRYLFLCLLLLTDHGTPICSAVLVNSHFSPRLHTDNRDKCKVSAIPCLVVKYHSHALPRFLFVSIFLNIMKIPTQQACHTLKLLICDIENIGFVCF